MAWNPSWNPLVQLSRRMTTPKTLELEQIRTIYLFTREPETNSAPSTNFVLYADGSNGTFWASDGIQSTITGLGNFGFLSSIPLTLHLSTLSSSSLQVSSITSRNIYIHNTGTAVFSDGYISANTVVVYGSNTAYVDGTLQLVDSVTSNLVPIYLRNGALWSGSTTYMLISSQLISTVEGLGSAGNLSTLGYISTLSLQSTVFGIRDLINDDKRQSTVTGLGSANYNSTLSMMSTVRFFNNYFSILGPSTIRSTVQGLGSADYISSASLQSTNAYFESTLGVVSPEMLQSTIDQLAEIDYISTAHLVSTSYEFLSNTIYVKPLALASTVRGLGTSRYISTRSLQSTVRTLFERQIVDADLESTIDGLSLVEYVSTLDLQSTSFYFLSNYPSYINIRSTVVGLGSAQYVSTLSLYSTVRSMSNRMFLNRGLTSTIVNLGRLRFISTSGLTSTVTGILTYPDRVDNLQLASTVFGLSNDFYITTSSIASTIADITKNAGAVSIDDFTSTIEGLGTFGFISTLDLVSTTDEFVGFLTRDRLTSTVAGLGNSEYVSSTGLMSTVFYLSTTLIPGRSLESTVRGLGTASYISTLSLFSTVRKLISQTDTLNIPSTIENLGTQDYVSTASLRSTVRDITTKQFTTNLNLFSTVSHLGTGSYISTNSLFSTVTSIIGGAGFQVTACNLASTTTGLGRARYVSTLSLQSTVSNLIQFGNAQVYLFSTVEGLESASYVSTATLESTVASLVISASPDSNLIQMVRTLGLSYISTPSFVSTVASFNFLDTRNVTSTVEGLGSIYLSTPSVVSTVNRIYNDFFSLSGLPSSVATLGALDYISTLSIQSTISFLTGATGRTQLGNLVSTVQNLGMIYIQQLNLNSTASMILQEQFTPASLRSTTRGLGSSRYVSSLSLISTVQYMFSVSLSVDSLTSTVANLGTTAYISTASLYSTTEYFISPNQATNVGLQSSVTGFALQYVSSSMLTSTTAGLFGTPGVIIRSQVQSTIAGLGSANYISTLDLQSTANFMGNNPNAFSTEQMVSTVEGLVVTGYVNSPQLQSTVFFISTNQLNVPQLRSTIATLGALQYVSTLSLASTTQNVFDSYQQIFQVASTVAGLRSASYISSPSLISTVAFFTTVDSAVSTFALQSTTTSLGFTSYVSSLSMQSTIATLFSLYPSVTELNSTVTGLATQSYVSTTQLASSVLGIFNTKVHVLSLQSTVRNLGLPGFVSTSQLTSTIDFFVPRYTNIGSLISTTNSLGGSDLQYVSTSGLTSTVGNLFDTSQQLPQAISTVIGLGSASYLSSVSLTSTVAVFTTIDSAISRFNLQSTVVGLGTVNYTSSLSVQSTVTSIFSLNPNNTQLASTAVGLATLGYVSTTQLTSTIFSFFRTATHISRIQSTVANASLAGFVSSSQITSTIDFFVPRYTQVNSLFSTLNNLSGSNLSYLSSASLVSTSMNILANKVTLEDFQSTFVTAGSLGYISSLDLASTVLGMNTTIQSLSLVVPGNFLSTVRGLGGAGYVSTLSLASTTLNIANFYNTFLNNITLQSSVRGLGTANYVSTLTSSLLVNVSSLTVGNRDKVNFDTDFSLDIGGTIRVIPTISNIIYSAVGVYNAPPKGGGDGTNGTRWYSFDGINWSNWSTTTNTVGSNITFAVCPGAYDSNWANNTLGAGEFALLASMCFNGSHFILQEAPLAENIAGRYKGLRFYYSTDGRDWRRSINTFPNGNATGTYEAQSGSFLVGKNVTVWVTSFDCITASIYAIFRNDSTLGDWILYMSNNDPTRWYRATVNWQFDMRNSTDGFFKAGAAYNGIFFCIVGGASAGAGATKQAWSTFISFDGITWQQSNVGPTYTNYGYTCFRIGQWIYITTFGSLTNISYTRSVDGRNWSSGSFPTGFRFDNVDGAQIKSYPLARGTAIANQIFNNATNQTFDFSLYSYNSARSNLLISYSNTFINNRHTRVFNPAVPNSFFNFKKTYNDAECILNGISTRDCLITSNVTTFFNVPNPWSVASGSPNYSNAFIDIATNYDGLQTNVQISNSLDIISYISVVDVSRRQNSNFIYANTIPLNSTMLVFNEGMFVDGRFNAMIVGGSLSFNCNYNLIGSNPIGQPLFSDSATLDVDGQVYVTNTNAVKPTGTNWTGYSDMRIKSSIVEADYARCYSSIKSIELMKFNFISSFYDKYETEDKSQLGFIAQNVSSVFPKAIMETEVMSTPFLTLNTTQIFMSLFGATKQLISTVEFNSTILSQQEHQIIALSNYYSTLIAVSGNV